MRFKTMVCLLFLYFLNLQPNNKGSRATSETADFHPLEGFGKMLLKIIEKQKSYFDRRILTVVNFYIALVRGLNHLYYLHTFFRIT